jgi:hypothetical protein
MSHDRSGVSYDERCRRAVADALARGHADPANRRQILVWTTNKATAPTVEAYFAHHRNDPRLLQSLIAIALEGEDAGDTPWAAANTIAHYPGAMLRAHRASLEQLAEHPWAYLHVPARQALAKIAATRGPP